MASDTSKFFEKCLHNFVVNPMDDKCCKKQSKEKFSKERQFEKQYDFCPTTSVVQQLYVDGMDDDQIWEQISANDEERIDLNTDFKPKNRMSDIQDIYLSADPDSVLFSDVLTKDIIKKVNKNTETKSTATEVESLEEDIQESGNDSDLADMSGGESSNLDGEDEEEDHDSGSSNVDEGVAGSDEAESDEQSENSDNEVKKGNEYEKEYDSDASNNSEDSAYDELDKQLFEKYSKKAADSEEESDMEDVAIASGEEYDSDEDDITKLNDDDDDEDEEEDNEENLNNRKKRKTDKSLNSNPLNKIVVPEFGKSSVDSEFFNVRESEWVADQDILGGKNFDDIDFMEDIDDSGETATYADFFDTPNISKNKKNKKKVIFKEGEEEEGHEMEDWGEADNEEEEEKEGEADNNEEAAVMEAGADVASQEKSRLEEELEKETKLRSRLEESNIGEKNWTLKGEVRATDRPKDSVLGEYLDFRSGLRTKPEITDNLNIKLEKLAVTRIRTKTYDSVERKQKLEDDPFEYKKKVVLDQEKSHKSLSKIYEEEYLKKERSETAKLEKRESPEHKDIRKKWEELEYMLNKLCRANYTPDMKKTEIKITVNSPALKMEEATPDIMCDADTLAPQEILDPTKGELKGDSEKNVTDKNRDRRTKKHRQGLKYKEINKRLDAKVKKAEKQGKKLDIGTSAKVVKKALKVGQVVMMDSSAASVKSSKSFFKQLTEQHAAQTKTQKRKRSQAS